MRSQPKCSTSTATHTIRFTSMPPKFSSLATKFRVIVLTTNRARSLQRLLLSLNNAFYDDDRVDLQIWIDRMIISINITSYHSHVFSANTTVVDKAVLATASKFRWLYGKKTVHIWDKHVGIWGQWIDSYAPQNPADCGAVILEDDLEVSTQFYKWLRQAKQSYGDRNDIIGYSLQRPELRANNSLVKGRPIRPPKGEPVFLYKLLGSWGFAPHPVRWKQFREWFHNASCLEDYHPYVDGLLLTEWYKRQEERRSMWTMWGVKFNHMKNLYCAYANLPNEKTLASHWYEAGLHYGSKGNSNRGSGLADHRLLSEEDDQEGNGNFRFPNDPIAMDWDGSYINRQGAKVS